MTSIFRSRAIQVGPMAPDGEQTAALRMVQRQQRTVADLERQLHSAKIKLNLMLEKLGKENTAQLKRINGEVKSGHQRQVRRRKSE